MRKEVLNENRVVLTNKGNILEALPLPLKNLSITSLTLIEMEKERKIYNSITVKQKRTVNFIA